MSRQVSFLSALPLVLALLAPAREDDPSERGREPGPGPAGVRTDVIEWVRVGQPPNARKIAACQDGTLYYLQVNLSLWRSRTGGVDGSWEKLGFLDGAANIVCAANLLFFQDGKRRLFQVERGDAGTFRLKPRGRPSGAAQLAGTEDAGQGRPVLWALNDDKTLWWNGKTGQDGEWKRVGLLRGADRIAATATEVWALNADKSLWRNGEAGRSATWLRIENAKGAVEIAASRSRSGGLTTLWVLQDDHSLWRGTYKPSVRTAP